MRHIRSVFYLGFLFLAASFARQQEPIDQVISALRAGNAQELSRYFDDNLELTLPGKSESYSRSQAQLILKDFFSTNRVKGFELKHKGNSPGGSYCIGTLQTQAGSFRTNVFMRDKGGRETVREIRLQPIE